MGDKLLHPAWGDDSVNYTAAELAEARARFRRRDRLMMLIVALLLAAGVAGQILHHYWPARDCVQIGEYTCVETSR